MATAQTRALVIAKIAQEWRSDPEVAVVVSAMGRIGSPYATDSLLGLVQDAGISARERDLLLTCGETIAAVTLSGELASQGIPAEALTGAQAGIRTTDDFGRAEVTAVVPDRVQAVWEKGCVAVIAGFQGETALREPTTLGRGGSDTSAVVLGAALGYPVDIYTDVPGIFTADPRVVATAAILPEVAYHEVLEMAVAGAKVIHPRAVSEALTHQVPVRVLSTFDGRGGTMIRQRRRPLLHQQEKAVTGIAHQTGLISLAVHADNPDPIRMVLDGLSAAGITIDMINLFGRDFYCVIEGRFRPQVEMLLTVLPLHWEIKDPVTKVTAVGEAISEWPGVMLQITEALARAAIPILQTSDSLYTISLLVDEEQGVRTVNALHDFFQLSNGLGAPL